MKNIIINGKISSVDTTIEYLTDNGEIDFDILGYYMTDQNAFDLTLNDFNNRVFTLKELITRYLELACVDLIIEIC